MMIKTWSQFIQWASSHRRIIRLAALTAGLAVVLAFMPAYLRTVFWKGLLNHRTLTGMLFVFCLIAVSLVWSTGQRLNAWIFLAFNVRGSRPIWLDKAMFGFTQIGSGFTALGISLIILITGQRLLLYQFMLGTVTLWMVVELLKYLIHRSRPHFKVTQARIVGLQASGLSFPSGHTSQVFFMAVLFTQYLQTNGAIVFVLYTTAFLVGVTRMYVGAHYPRDVLAGAIFGSVWGILAGIINPYLFR